jgi:hypothetical protein
MVVMTMTSNTSRLRGIAETTSKYEWVLHRFRPPQTNEWWNVAFLVSWGCLLWIYYILMCQFIECLWYARTCSKDFLALAVLGYGGLCTVMVSRISHTHSTSPRRFTSSSTLQRPLTEVVEQSSMCFPDRPLPLHCFDKTNAIVGQSMSCCICLEDFDDHEVLCAGPRCHHLFHAPCISTWMMVCRGQEALCPYCRCELSASPSSSMIMTRS